MNKAFRSDNPVVVIYHSHPDVGAYFSDEDQDKALFLGEPIFPVSYLVVDVRQARPWAPSCLPGMASISPFNLSTTCTRSCP